MQNFRVIRAPSIQLSLDKKLTTYTKTNKQTDGQTHIHTFSANDFFFQCRLYINIENGEIEESIFDTEGLKVNFSKFFKNIVLFLDCVEK